MPEIDHYSLPVLASGASEEGYNRSSEVLEVYNFLIDLCTKSYILKQKPRQTGLNEEKQEDKPHDVH